MVFEYQCPDPDCEFTAQDTDQDVVVESAQQHQQDSHGNSATRDEVIESVTGV